MNKYEAMIIIKPDLSEDDKKTVINQLGEAITKNNGAILQSDIWSERRKLIYPIQKYREGTYYLIQFNVLPEAIVKIRHTYKLNENILRILITKNG